MIHDENSRIIPVELLGLRPQLFTEFLLGCRQTLGMGMQSVATHLSECNRRLDLDRFGQQSELCDRIGIDHDVVSCLRVITVIEHDVGRYLTHLPISQKGDDGIRYRTLEEPGIHLLPVLSDDFPELWTIGFIPGNRHSGVVSNHFNQIPRGNFVLVALTLCRLPASQPDKNVQQHRIMESPVEDGLLPVLLSLSLTRGTEVLMDGPEIECHIVTNEV